MSDLESMKSSGIPNGIAMRVVSVNSRKAEKIKSDGLFQSTAREFERVRTNYPFNNYLRGIERAYQSLRGRNVRPLHTIPNNDSYDDDLAVIIASPVAQLSDGTGDFCVTARAVMPEVYYGPDLPYLALLYSGAKKTLELHRAHQTFIDTETMERGISHFKLESLGAIDAETVLAPEQTRELAAVYLGLKVSSWT